MRQKIYIAGAISGEDWEQAKSKFKRAQRILEEFGDYDVVNPCDHEIENGTWEGYMKQGIRELIECDGLLALDSWSYSRGAQIEVRLAKDLGLFIMYEDKDLQDMVNHIMNYRDRRW
jgi:hypothetical protein